MLDQNCIGRIRLKRAWAEEQHKKAQEELLEIPGHTELHELLLQVIWLGELLNPSEIMPMVNTYMGIPVTILEEKS